jgi:outer membrane lipoprotein carrier protein
MRSMTTFVATGLMLFAGAASAGARDQLDSFTKGLKSLDGRFTQQVFDTKGKLKESSSGRVSLAAPRQFRWEYAKPIRSRSSRTARPSGSTSPTCSR